MPATAALPENYCVCVGEDGAPREIGRSGSAVTYKAMGYQSGQAVALQLIPLANVSEAGRAEFERKARAVRKLKHPNIARVYDVRVEDDHLVFATEFLQGETAEHWVVTHGPMPADAAVRVGLQVVSALAEAAFHSLSHRAIQPSNLMIVNGAAPDGDWPFVKLLNFGLAGLKLYSDEQDELTPPMGAAFASPEQLAKGKVDFRSEIFSLGATMCFLLTGAVPTAGRARRAGEGERVLPSGARIPRPLRKLLGQMLRINPDERPHDPLLLTGELHNCLQKVERRRAFTRAAPVSPSIETAPVSPSRKNWTGPMLTAATVLLLLGALAVVVLPGQLRWWTHRERSLETIGVPIGVPEDASRQAESPLSPIAQPGSSVAATPETRRGRIEQLRAQTTPSSTAAPSVAAAEPSIAASSAPTSAPVESRNPEAEIAQAAPAIAESPAVPEQPTRSRVAQVPPVEHGSDAASTESAPQSSSENKPTVSDEPAQLPVSQGPAQSEVAINNRVAEPPPPPAEAPPSPVATPVPPQNTGQGPAVAQQQNPPQQTEKSIAELAEPEQARTTPSPPPKVGARPKTSPAAVQASRGSSTATRRSTSRSSGDHTLPAMRVGSEQAQFVRTTDDGKWVLRLPSGETVVTPPLPRTNVSDAPVISHRKVRKVQAAPQTVPADDRSPVVVLPPDN